MIAAGFFFGPFKRVRNIATISNVIITIIGLIILWIIASIPAYLAGKAVTGGKASFGQAMGATLGGTIIYGIVLIGVTLFLGTLIGASAGFWALILGFIAWLAVYRASFDTGWLGALAIAVLSVFVFLILNILLGSLFGVALPDLFPFEVPL